MIKKILVAVDGSEHASKAIEFAANTAQQNNAAIQLLHVIQSNKIPTVILEYMRGERIEEPPEKIYFDYVQNSILDTAQKMVKKKGIMDVETTVLEGDPAEQITKYANEGDFDMVVIGSRGLGNVKGLLLGSVSSKVCHLIDRTCVTVK